MSESTVQDNKSLVMRFNDEVFNDHDLDGLNRFLSTRYFNHVTGTSGAEDFKRVVRYILSVAPDSTSHIDDVIAEGDTVVLFLTWSGTHRGEVTLAGRTLRPTGVRFAVTHVHRYRVVDDKIVEHFAVRDDLSLLRQLEEEGGLNRPPTA